MASSLCCEVWVPDLDLQASKSNFPIELSNGMAGYSFSILASIFKTFRLKWKNSIHTWFNTGASRRNDCFILQYSNTIIVTGFYLMMIYRVIAFIFQYQGYNGWMSIGALIYGFAMLLQVHAWSLQPFRETQMKAIESTEADPSLSGRRRSPHSLAFLKFNEHKEANQRLDFSLLFIIVNVVIITEFLLLWGAKGNCGSQDSNPITTADITLPPIPEGIVFHAEFTSSQGKLVLNKEPFQVKGINWFGFERTWNVAFSVNRRSQDSVLKQIVEDGINTLRIPVAVESVFNPSQYLTDPWAIDG